ncbi:MAG: DUF4293 family protein [Cytophagales bacterium]|nr:DUF4293 family protein [Cytophagales bacterium]
MFARLRGLSLLGAFFCLLGTYFFPFWTKKIPNLEAEIYLGPLMLHWDGQLIDLVQGDIGVLLNNLYAFPYLGIGAGIGIFVLIWTSISYTDLNRQMILSKALFLLIGLLICLVFFFTHQIEKMIPTTGQVVGTFRESTYLTILALILVFFARLGIKRDQRLVDSSSRLR